MVVHASTSLAQDQSAFVRVCLSASPSEDDLTQLGADRERWLLYRDMVRSRMKGMIASGLKRTVATLGDATFTAWFRAWLDEAPPTTRYIREIVPQFVAFVERAHAQAWPNTRVPNEALPLQVRELARFESARWTAAYREVPRATPGRPFDFEGAPILNGTAEIMRFAYPVHREGDAAEIAAETTMVIYRRDDNDHIGYYTVPPIFERLFILWREQTLSVTDSVKRVCHETDTPLDKAFVESLTGVLAALIERRVILGVMPPDAGREH